MSLTIILLYYNYRYLIIMTIMSNNNYDLKTYIGMVYKGIIESIYTYYLYIIFIDLKVINL